MCRLIGSKLVIATHNAGKLGELCDLLEPFQVSCIGAKELGLPVPEETEQSFEGNAFIKARSAAALSGLPALSDDSGLEIDALNGAPGVNSADWAESATGRDFGMAMERVSRELSLSGRPKPWLARFRCVLAVAWPDGQGVAFHGSCEGRVVWPMRGEHGHGYDPIFVPDGFDVTFGEMNAALKNRLSHRAVAFDRFLEACFT